MWGTAPRCCGRLFKAKLECARFEMHINCAVCAEHAFGWRLKFTVRSAAVRHCLSLSATRLLELDFDLCKVKNKLFVILSQ